MSWLGIIVAVIGTGALFMFYTDKPRDEPTFDEVLEALGRVVAKARRL